jgi:hypothetical protein
MMRRGVTHGIWLLEFIVLEVGHGLGGSEREYSWLARWRG